MNWLCRLVGHRWSKEGLTYIMSYDRVQVCKRCGWGRRTDLNGAAFCYLSPEEVQRYRDLGTAAPRVSHAS
jgi:hypothetical protein